MSRHRAPADILAERSEAWRKILRPELAPEGREPAVPATQAQPPTGAAGFLPGDRVRLELPFGFEWNGTVLSDDGGVCRVHFDGNDYVSRVTKRYRLTLGKPRHDGFGPDWSE